MGITEKVCLDILAKNELFEGIATDELQNALEYLGATIKEYDKGEYVIQTGEDVVPGIVLSGELQTHYINGYMNVASLEHIAPGNMYGHTATCTPRFEAPVDIVAVKKTKVLALDFSLLLEDSTEKRRERFHHRLIINLLKSVASHAAFLNLRVRTLGQRTIRNRLRVYLNDISEGNTGWIEIPFSMTALASFLDSDRSALYKEIKLLKEEGILSWEKRRFKIHKQEFINCSI